MLELEVLIKSAQLCSAVYLKDDELVSSIGSTIGWHATVKPFHVLETDGAVALDGDHAICIFRGTESADDIRSDVNVIKTKAGIHKGFYNGYMRAKDTLLSLMGEAKSVSYYGHSLGGALCLIAAMDSSIAVRDVITFGCPRAFGHAAAINYDNNLGDITYCVINASDPVARIPSAIRFSRVGKQLFMPAMICHMKQGDPPFAAWNWKTRIKSVWTDLASGGGVLSDHFIQSYIDKLTTIKKLIA